MHWEIELPLARVDQAAPSDRFGGRVASPQAAHLSVAAAPSNLKEKRFAVVEDEPLLAMDIVAALEQEGALVLGPVATVSDALRIIEGNRLDAALIDANLRGRRVDDIAGALTRKGVPF